ncbi:MULTISPECIES: YSC84-related protein [Thalassotalea]|uniref:YSC84-related protein n=1 Tax=Thalassotalea castellviae TaxID=3075612 RepID=A0ABU2ZYZ8_9GAMM|nr:YSC84-related protein [Thalassotalea sp. W431]MDT0603146.1 YSC84-related protein [Thalassotalea sp. W431]
MKKYLIVMICALISLNVLADKQADRQEVLDMSKDVLAKLYQEEPSVKEKIAEAKGYAVFSNIGVNLVFFSAGGGSGVVHDNQSGKNTYMNMGSAGIGIGFGVKDFSAVFIFHTRDALNDFIEYGWDFSGQADVAAKSGKKGAEGSKAVTVVNGVSIYQMTENGLALQATLQGTKYWVDSDLN